MSKNPRFWRNVTLIALAHVAVIAGLIRWSLAARSAPDAERLVWLNAGDLESGNSEDNVLSSSKSAMPPVGSEALNGDEEEKEQPSLTQAKSEIELPKPTPMKTPVAMATVKPEASSKPTPKPTAKSTPKKTLLAKATKSPSHAKPSPSKPTRDQTDARIEKQQSVKTVGAKTKSSADIAGKTGSAGNVGGHSGGGSSASEFGWYGNMLHDRFYSAWVQPTSTAASGAKISTLVKVRIEMDGR